MQWQWLDFDCYRLKLHIDIYIFSTIKKMKSMQDITPFFTYVSIHLLGKPYKYPSARKIFFKTVLPR